jgi:hypothetical protein
VLAVSLIETLSNAACTVSLDLCPMRGLQPNNIEAPAQHGRHSSTLDLEAFQKGFARERTPGSVRETKEGAHLT